MRTRTSTAPRPPASLIQPAAIAIRYASRESPASLRAQ
jgi:hypothetical protein